VLLKLNNIDDVGIDWSELEVKPEKVETAKKSTSSHEHRPPLTFGYGVLRTPRRLFD
jgi:hypothetical protein